ncbi:hypothetical protein P5673_008614 [Acropora cervicornis]|uniref:Uncharacterized protein n=1 Tax=Acropora cervicornis TaxID=6130 RepID=A0AAD9QT24_ACRCE|nr:hypothetical protein P5673_008614 [Acropora cervicornis]
MQVTYQQSYITYHAIQEMFKEPGMVESHLDPITSSVTQSKSFQSVPFLSENDKRSTEAET